MKIDGSIYKSGFPIDFVPVLMRNIKDKDIYSDFELKMIALFKKNKGKKKKTKKKGGGKFRRTRRKQGGDKELKAFLASNPEGANEVILTILGNMREKVDDPTDEDGWSLQSTWGRGQSSEKLAETLIGQESWLRKNNQYFKHRGPFDGNGLRSDGGKKFLTKFIKYHKKQKGVCKGTMFSPCEGGRKSKYNIKMARKFRRTRRKRGSGGAESDEEFKARMDRMCSSIQSNIEEARQKGTSLADLQTTYQSDLDWCNANYFTKDVKLGGKKSRRKRRRRTKKRKSRRRKKRTRRRKKRSRRRR